MIEYKINAFTIWLCHKLNWSDKLIIDKINYGLLSLSYNILKFILLSMIAIILNLYFQFIIFLIVYGTLRIFSFGIHMSTPKKCFIFSAIIIYGSIFIANFVQIPIIISYFIFIFSMISYTLYSPSFMKNKVKRNYIKKKQLKNYTLLAAILYFLISLYISNKVLQQLILFALFIQSVLILPITFQILGKKVNDE